MPNITTLFEGTDGVSRTLFNQKLSDINAHGNDATMHVTMAEKSVWNGKANGNNAVWVATDVVQGSTPWFLSLTVPNFIFTEGCQVTFRIPTLDFTGVSSGNAWGMQINTPTSGATYRFINGGSNTSENLVYMSDMQSNAIITVTLSRALTDPVNSINGTAFFKGGSGSLKEILTFPLSIQTAEPTPLDTNHIWILNDTKRLVMFDEAVRSDPLDDSYWIIQDNMDNSFIYLYSPMRTTDNVTVPSLLRKVNRDAVPWRLSARGGTNGYGHFFAKKNGINFYADITSKWPRVLSRVGSTIDVESAKRWDGSTWQWLSQKGNYLISPAYFSNRTEGVISNTRAYDPTVNGRVAISLDRNWVARSGAGGVKVYKRNGDTLTLNTTFPEGGINSTMALSFSEDCQYLAFSTGTGGYRCVIAKLVNGAWSIVSELTYNVPSGGTCYATNACWNSAQNLLIVRWTISYSRDTYIVYQRSGDSFSIKNQSTLTTVTYRYFGETMISKDNDLYDYYNYSTESGGGIGHHVRRMSLSDFSSINSQYLGNTARTTVSFARLSNGNLIFLKHAQARDYVQIWDASLGTRLANLDLTVRAASFALSFDERYLFVSLGGSSVSVFTLSGNTLTYLTNISTIGYNSDSIECW
ncbi:MAG: hypothetical protein E6579_15790 [Clostridium sp.]|nr:hypothetical protein [Clostridium sp.]